MKRRFVCVPHANTRHKTLKYEPRTAQSSPTKRAKTPTAHDSKQEERTPYCTAAKSKTKTLISGTNFTTEQPPAFDFGADAHRGFDLPVAVLLT
eukprot:2486734-Rhodomonas_salina.1